VNYANISAIVKQIRSGRKIFKLAKFVDEFKEFDSQVRELDWNLVIPSVNSLFRGKYSIKNPVLAELLHLVTKFTGFFYYLLDNLIWFANVGAINDKILKLYRYESFKDIFNLIRKLTNLCRGILNFSLERSKLADIECELNRYDSKVVGTTCIKAADLVRKYLNQRSKLYNQMFVLITNLLRIIMLGFKLKTPIFRHYFHSVSVAFVGILMNIAVLFKIWLAKRYDNLNLAGRLIKVQDCCGKLPRMDDWMQL